MQSGVIILESEDPISSLLRNLITNDKNSYIGFYYKFQDILVVKLYETMTGLIPEWFGKEIPLENLNKLPFIKRITYFESKIDLKPYVKDLGHEENELVYKSIFQYYLCKKKIYWRSGYTIVNEILAEIMNIDLNPEDNLLCIIDNNILKKKVKLINDVVKYDKNISYPRLITIFKCFIELYTKDTHFKYIIDHKYVVCSERNIRNREQELKKIIETMREKIRNINNKLRSEEIITIDLNSMISDYNILVKNLGIGKIIDDENISTSGQAIVYSKDSLDIYSNTLRHEKISINDRNNFLINSDLDGEIIIPLYGCDLSNLCQTDLKNLLEMVNNLNLSDHRFVYLQNHILEILERAK